MIALMNESRVVWGLTALFASIGSKYIMADIGHVQDYLLSTPVMKSVIVFSMFFMATRDATLSALLSVGYAVLFVALLHEQSRYSVVPKHVRDKLVEAKRPAAPEGFTTAQW